MKIEEKDLCLLEQKYIPDIRGLLEQYSIGVILETIDDMIVDDILAHNDEPSNKGLELQQIYDRILYSASKGTNR